MLKTRMTRFCLSLFVLSLINITAWASQDQRDAYGRTTLGLEAGWKFAFGAEGESIESPAFDDREWQQVTVPHSWNRVGFYNNDLVEHLNTPATVDQRMGVGWYRLSFIAPQHSSARRSWLEFDAASRVAQVWLNGEYLGEHRNGFNRFRFDATNAVRPGAENLLVVKVDNSKPTADSSTADSLPLAGDFFVHGGLYRPVRLITTSPVHIDMQDFGGPGVYATTRLPDDRSAQVSVRSRVANADTSSQSVGLTVSLLDNNQQVVAKRQVELALDAGTTQEASLMLNVENPRLWQGTADPYLYTLRVEVRSADNSLLDALDQSYGIRTISVDANKGFYLNSVRQDLRGVAYHQDREGKGWAVSAEDTAEDIAIMRDMGVNTIRLAHYPHGQPVHDLADQQGLILWDEIPLVTVWTYGAEHELQNRAIIDNARTQMQEMIRQNFNHPSVAVWGVANEVDFGALVPAFLGAKEGEVPDPVPLLKELSALAHQEDSSRPTTLANCCEAVESMQHADIPVTTSVADVVGLNRYFGWYYPPVDGLGSHLDLLHGRFENSPLSISEYGAGGAVSLHTDNALGGPVDARGRNQPEEYMSLVHERNWLDISSRPYIWSSWIWNSFDFATTIRREGDAIDINTKGLVTYDRRIKKDAYFFYRANWTDTPTVHINGRRYVHRAYQATDVRVYSNAPRTELLVNGSSQGVRSDCAQNICVWNAVRLSGGDNTVSAQGYFDAATVSDSVNWNLASAAVNSYRIDAGALIAADSGNTRFGSDSLFTGGAAGTVDRLGGWGQKPVLAEIADTEHRERLATYREGDFSYRLPLDNGPYRVRLGFMEPAASAGERSFDVIANGETRLSGMDIAREAGGELRAITREFVVVVSDGAIELAFRPVGGNALVSAIEIDSVQP